MFKAIKKSYFIVIGAIVLVLGLSGLACSYPDGLEYVSEMLKFNSLEINIASFHPFTSYETSFISNSYISTLISGIAGTIMSFTVALFLFKNLARS